MMLILFWPAPCFGVHRQGRQGGALGGGQGAEVQLRGLHSASIINIFFPRQHFYLCQRWQLAGGLSLIFCSGGSGHNQDPQPKSNHLIMRTKNFKQSDNEGDEGVSWYGTRPSLSLYQSSKNTFDNGLMWMRRVSAVFPFQWEIFHTDHIADLNKIIWENVSIRNLTSPPGPSLKVEKLLPP